MMIFRNVKTFTLLQKRQRQNKKGSVTKKADILFQSLIDPNAFILD